MGPSKLRFNIFFLTNGYQKGPDPAIQGSILLNRVHFYLFFNFRLLVFLVMFCELVLFV